MQVVAEPLVQEAVDLADGDAGLRHLDLDVAGPGAVRIQALVRAARGVLELLQRVQHARGHHVARHPAAGQGRGGLKGVHHHRTGGEGVVEHH